uniref:Uncharacterized protein n=1 Tax=Coptotermes formosanus TaxID=36987 RepID=R4UMJ2_COPFO|nr:hypothetical protein [Coptotermes formosanus]
MEKKNETIFRESQAAVVRKAEVRRNIKRNAEDAIQAKIDYLLDRRMRLAALVAAERTQWEDELVACGYTFPST